MKIPRLKNNPNPGINILRLKNFLRIFKSISRSPRFRDFALGIFSRFSYPDLQDFGILGLFRSSPNKKSHPEGTSVPKWRLVKFWSQISEKGCQKVTWGHIWTFEDSQGQLRSFYVLRVKQNSLSFFFADILDFKPIKLYSIMLSFNLPLNFDVLSGTENLSRFVPATQIFTMGSKNEPKVFGKKWSIS